MNKSFLIETSDSQLAKRKIIKDFFYKLSKERKILLFDGDSFECNVKRVQKVFNYLDGSSWAIYLKQVGRTDIISLYSKIVWDN